MEEQIKKYLEVPQWQAKLEKKLLIAQKTKKEMAYEWIEKGITYRIILQNLAHIVAPKANKILRANFDDICAFAHTYTIHLAMQYSQPRLFYYPTNEEYVEYLLSSICSRVANIFVKGRRENEEFFKNYLNLYYKADWVVATTAEL